MSMTVMSDEQFWAYIHASLPVNEGQEERLLELLKPLSCSERKAFANAFSQKLEDAYRWDTWGAAYVYDGGCSDDSFTDFRSGLVSLGKTDYQMVLDYPDGLEDILKKLPDGLNLFRERFGYVYLWAYEDCGELGLLEIKENQHPLSVHREGVDWDFDDEVEMQARYPRLWAAYGVA